MSGFKVGDRVRVAVKGSAYNNAAGTIVDTDHMADMPLWVKFDNEPQSLLGKTPFDADELVAV